MLSILCEQRRAKSDCSSVQCANHIDFYCQNDRSLFNVFPSTFRKQILLSAVRKWLKFIFPWSWVFRFSDIVFVLFILYQSLTKVSRRQIDIVFYFSRKQALTFYANCLETICMKCQSLFPVKKFQKNISKYRLLKFLTAYQALKVMSATGTKESILVVKQFLSRVVGTAVKCFQGYLYTVTLTLSMPDFRRHLSSVFFFFFFCCFFCFFLFFLTNYRFERS